jgi:hypothetical protein
VGTYTGGPPLTGNKQTVPVPEGTGTVCSIGR